MNLLGSQARADRMIKRWGKGLVTVLRRASGDRPCSAVSTSFLPMERLGKITNPTDRKYLVSALAPDGSLLDPPVFDGPNADRLVVAGVEYRLTEPAGQIGTSDVVVFWRLAVRR
jgi:hypothetical protein